MTARASVLAIAVISVALTLAPSFKTWLSQRTAIASVQTRNAATKRQVARLQRQEQLWHDPAYIEREARQRLHYVMPGQTSYVVIGHAPHSARKPTVTKRPSDEPWWSQLWSEPASRS